MPHFSNLKWRKVKFRNLDINFKLTTVIKDYKLFLSLGQQVRINVRVKARV